MDSTVEEDYVDIRKLMKPMVYRDTILTNKTWVIFHRLNGTDTYADNYVELIIADADKYDLYTTTDKPTDKEICLENPELRRIALKISLKNNKVSELVNRYISRAYYLVRLKCGKAELKDLIKTTMNDNPVYVSRGPITAEELNQSTYQPMFTI